MVLVSAIYNNGPSSVIGGRGRDISFYYSTLRNIGNLDVPFVLYCDPFNVEKYKAILSPYFKNLYVYGFELKSFPFYTDFITWKETFWQKIELNDRNEVLCYGKFYFLLDAISKNLFNSEEQYFWIDSGLTHHGIIPEKVGGVELLIRPSDDIYYPYNTNNIFTPLLASKLSNHIPQNKLFFCGHPLNYSPNYNLINLVSNIFDQEQNFNYHIIGGIFGGNTKLLKEFFSKYEILLQKAIENKIHTLEEQLFTVLYPYFQDIILLEKFSNWWFYSPGERNSFLTEEADSFYKIFTRIYEQ